MQRPAARCDATRPARCSPQRGPYDAAIDTTIETPAVADAPHVRRMRFPTFEGLRALCAMGVLVYHAGTFTGLTWGTGVRYAGVGPWVQHLNVGVSVFFVLSGFLLFRPFVLAHLEGRPGPRVPSYLLRRFVRIYPAYWVALFVSTQLIGLDLGDWWGHVRFYGLIQIYWGETVLGGLVPAWSLCTEVSFYLFVPIWAAGLARQRGDLDRRIRTHYVALGVLYLSAVVVRAQLRAGDHAVGYGTLPANADLFAIGMALAVASAASAARNRPVGGLLKTIGDAPVVAWVAAACVYAGVVSLRYPYGFDPPTVFQETARQAMFGIIAGLVVAPGVFGPQDRGAIRAVLRWRPIVAVGIVSYGVYLWHLPIMERLAQPDSPLAPPQFWPLVLWCSAATLTVATVSWFVLERPLLRRVRRRPGSSAKAPSSSVGP